jgi:hypothetical protein
MYINGIGALLPEVRSEGDPKMALASEPDYEGYIHPNQLRRMSRMVRMGLWAGKKCLQDASVETPDAIITSTAYGANEDTEKFLRSISGNESTGSPTFFIQSTHNVLGGQLALLMGCRGYNMTYTQGEFSFESGLIDSQLLLSENGGNILCGAADELTPLMANFHRAANKDNGNRIEAEGYVFFLLSATPGPKNYGAIIEIIVEADNAERFKEDVQSTFKHRNINEKNTLIICSDEEDVKFAGISSSYQTQTLNEELHDLSIYSAAALYKGIEKLKQTNYTYLAIVKQNQGRYLRMLLIQKPD